MARPGGQNPPKNVNWNVMGPKMLERAAQYKAELDKYKKKEEEAAAREAAQWLWKRDEFLHVKGGDYDGKLALRRCGLDAYGSHTSTQKVPAVTLTAEEYDAILEGLEPFGIGEDDLYFIVPRKGANESEIGRICMTTDMTMMTAIREKGGLEVFEKVLGEDDERYKAIEKFFIEPSAMAEKQSEVMNFLYLCLAFGVGAPVFQRVLDWGIQKFTNRGNDDDEPKDPPPTGGAPEEKPVDQPTTPEPMERVRFEGGEPVVGDGNVGEDGFFEPNFWRDVGVTTVIAGSYLLEKGSKVGTAIGSGAASFGNAMAGATGFVFSLIPAHALDPQCIMTEGCIENGGVPEA